MNKILLLLLLIPASLLAGDRSFAQSGIKDADRDYAYDYLKQSQKRIMKAVKGLNEAQFNFKPSPESWSIAECVEHLAISESLIFSFVQSSLKTEADPSKREEVKMTDDQIIQLITDRSSKIKTGEEFEPKNNFGSYQGSLDEFINRRKNNLKYLKTTRDDLRNHYFDFPFGKADTYQVILFMAGHSVRHAKQIEEILATPSFPES